MLVIESRFLYFAFPECENRTHLHAGNRTLPLLLIFPFLDYKVMAFHEREYFHKGISPLMLLDDDKSQRRRFCFVEDFD